MTVPLLLASLSAVPAAAQEGDAPVETHVGIRLGIATALAADEAPMPLASLHADARMVRGHYFVAIAPGMFLPAGGGDLSYGGLGMDLGAGWIASRYRLAPFVGAGVSGRLQFGDESYVGFAPYAHAGVLAKLTDSASVFVEGRAYQNVLRVGVRNHSAYPTEIGMAMGVSF